ncbi:MaoC family dehydratase [Rhodoblastus acidophilus]|uniref:MaoC family dehydratase n=1 Tax=Candidatus Rhodoblastus alkanivorans TaxID=2954117 RepID=A0ABS9Z2U9_9HYPH|nr:MaoC family dehydratase [Candidatus Rhodoblastus alkanivorans]MCI4679735.1 MaoC family dehydratase [Candidatus Rhodoblastus alkanivorans]MCI4681973.1 MaoC family dehydratase [Candidatus Rhodoblastus alkanivorans]MDI4643024.1 MaoC family dehydratase [Rhodoblastus acidophilus]
MIAECVAPRCGEKLPALTIGPFSADHLARYAEASGDSNPLHLDPAFARGFGFPARPVHGMRLLAAFEPLLADWRPDLVLLDLRGQFLTPVLEGQKALLTARVAKIEGDGARFIAVVRLVAQTESGAPALMGEARLAPAAKPRP